MKLADHLRVGSLRLLLGEVRHYRTPKWFGTCLCVYLSISSVKSTRLPASLLLYRCLPWRYTSYIRIWTKTRELLAATLVGKHTQRDTHTHTHTHTLLLPSQSPKWATFPCSTSCSNGSLQRRRDTVINQKAQRHGYPATDTQHRSTLIEENYLNVTAEDKVQGSGYLYKLL